MSKRFERGIARSGENRAEITVDLFKKNSIDNLIAALEGYKSSIRSNSELFVVRLADAGIRAAEHHMGDYAGYVEFTKEISGTDDGVVCLLVAKDRQKIVSRWKYKGGWREADVSPLLMAEFGSGWFAEVIFPVAEGSVGQGTFPEQKHAFDDNGWWWEDENGQRHHSYGEYPSHPMYQAWVEMSQRIEQIARGAFF